MMSSGAPRDPRLVHREDPVGKHEVGLGDLPRTDSRKIVASPGRGTQTLLAHTKSTRAFIDPPLRAPGIPLRTRTRASGRFTTARPCRPCNACESRDCRIGMRIAFSVLSNRGAGRRSLADSMPTLTILGFVGIALLLVALFAVRRRATQLARSSMRKRTRPRATRTHSARTEMRALGDSTTVMGMLDRRHAKVPMPKPGHASRAPRRR